jgi:Zn-dependent peptidase ImmA (M78 family)
MSRLVPYLPEVVIERDAMALLTEYARARGVPIAPPIPIEDIVEKHLKLGIEFDDTHRLFGLPRSGRDPDILGAMFFEDRRIVLDESLDPEENPAKEGRYRYTVAHEGGGHWRLHRYLLVKNPAQTTIFGGPTEPSVICRSSQAKEPIEWQADFYASCLLMPKKLVIEAWRERFGNTDARILKRKDRIPLPDDGDVEVTAVIRQFDQQRDDEVMNRFVRPFAEKFAVSMAAMRIRLERLGLLLREVPHQRILIGST